MSTAVETDAEVLSGVVTELRFEKPTFCAGYLTSAGRRVSFSVKGYVKVGEPVTVRGQWEEHPRWGRQFKGAEVVYTMPAEPDGIAAWLAASVENCGPVKARQLVDAYGKDLPQRLADDPEGVAVTCRLPIEFVRRMAETWHAAAERANLGATLAGHGLTQHEVAKLIARYKGSAVTILENDPYLLLGDLPGFGWKRVDAIGKKLLKPATFPGRVRAAVIEVVRKELDEGSTVVGREGLLNAAADMLGAAVGRAGVEAGLAEAVRLHSLVLVGDAGVCGSRPKQVEDYLWRRLLTAADPNPLFRPFTAEQIEDSVRRAAAVHYRGERVELDDSQVGALRVVSGNRFAVITGGAGAGKTLVAKAVAELLATGERADRLASQRRSCERCGNYPAIQFRSSSDGQLHTQCRDCGPPWLESQFEEIGSEKSKEPRVLFCAPTGKAARRLAEVLGRPAQTIHKLLEYDPRTGRFTRNAECPLGADAVIVDEVSMVDAYLLCDLFEAVGPDTAVVLIGDPNQLPPVGPGYPLRDVLEHDLAPAVRLEKCHRQAGSLKKNCVAVLAGVVEPTVVDQGDPGPWLVHRALNSTEAVVGAVTKLFAELFPKWGFAGLMDAQFVTARHDGKLGTRAMNELLQRLAQARLGVALKERGPDEALPLLLGDKVIHTRNNYALQVMNGTVGVVVEETPLAVEYDGRRVAYPADCRGEVELAYCLTCHKMQGSEVPCVAVVCPAAHAFMQHRSWLYTALTRARKTAVLFGDADGIRRAAEKVETSRRRTLLELYAKTPEVRP